MEKEVGPASQHPPNNRLHLTSAPVTRLADATRAPCRLRRLPLQVNLHVRCILATMQLSGWNKAGCKTEKMGLD